MRTWHVYDWKTLLTCSLCMSVRVLFYVLCVYILCNFFLFRCSPCLFHAQIMSFCFSVLFFLSPLFLFFCSVILSYSVIIYMLYFLCFWWFCIFFFCFALVSRFSWLSSYHPVLRHYINSILRFFFFGFISTFSLEGYTAIYYGQFIFSFFFHSSCLDWRLRVCLYARQSASRHVCFSLPFSLITC